MGCAGLYAVFRVIVVLLNVPVLLVIEIKLLCLNIKVTAEREVPHPDLFDNVLWLVLFFTVMFIRLFHVMTAQIRPMGIVPERICEIFAVFALTFAEPDDMLIVVEDTVPFVATVILIEHVFDIAGGLPERKDVPHPGIQQSGHVLPGIESRNSNWIIFTDEILSTR